MHCKTSVGEGRFAEIEVTHEDDASVGVRAAHRAYGASGLVVWMLAGPRPDRGEHVAADRHAERCDHRNGRRSSHGLVPESAEPHTEHRRGPELRTPLAHGADA